MRICYFVVAILLAAGCGRSTVAPVSGTVTLNGKPLAHATVVFQPEDGGSDPGRGSMGMTDENGRYQLRLMSKNAPGARVGKHKVSITAYADEEGDPGPAVTRDSVKLRALVPQEYNEKTKLTFDVPPGGSTSADFDIPSPAAR